MGVVATQAADHVHSTRSPVGFPSRQQRAPAYVEHHPAILWLLPLPAIAENGGGVSPSTRLTNPEAERELADEFTTLTNIHGMIRSVLRGRIHR